MKIEKLNIKENIKNILPKFVKNFLKNIILPRIINAKDYVDLLLGRRGPLIPPERFIFVGDGDFKSIGDEFYNYFVKIGGLKSGDRVLDIGCGIGRMARPLVTYLDSNRGGEYHGFDIVSDGIDWCKKNYEQYCNFHFELADIYNKCYNPLGKHESSEYKFKFEDNFFDFIYATSVFTHMLPKGVERYISEITRVLKIKGRCLFTFFILNSESKRLISSGISSQKFKKVDNIFWTINEYAPEDAIGYEEEYLRSIFKYNRLNIIGSIYYGDWCGREKRLSYQDVIITERY